MGGMGTEIVFEARDFLVCKSPIKLLLELAENPSAKR